MRWYGQLAVIAVLGGAGYFGWQAHKEGRLASLPVVGSFLAKPAGSAAPQPTKQAPPTVVDVDTVRTGRVVETREAVGTVRAFESITVTAKVSGVVESITFEEGQKVKAGDVLVRFDAEERRADIEQAAAELRRAQAQRDETRTRLDRAQALRRTGAGTEAQVDDLTAQIRTLESAIASAEARRKGAEARLDDLVIRAPFAGRLGTRSVSLGAYVSPGTRITTLDDLSKVRLDFAVPENLLAKVQPGQIVRALSAAFGARLFEGKVAVIDPRVDPVTRTIRLTADFANPDETLKPGMFLSVTVEVTAKDDAVVIPEEAIVGEGLRHLVFVVKDNVIERRLVRIGQRQDARIEIIEGLSPGETVVVRGVQRVRPGIAVDPKPIEPAKPAEIKVQPAPAASSDPVQNAPAPKSQTAEPANEPSRTGGPKNAVTAKPKTPPPVGSAAPPADRRG